MTPIVRTSYAQCRVVARRAASSFYLSFFLLPKSQRDAMCALYAFLRHTDDVADSAAPVEQRRRELAHWRAKLDGAMRGDDADPILPALADTAVRFDIPLAILHAAIDGAEMDLEVSRYRTFGELQQYCHCVASVVGLACLRIWGCRDERAEALARKCGLAFQLTNILRDVADDARRDRIYLPLEDLQRFGLREEEIFAATPSRNLVRLLQFEVERAQSLYEEATSLGPLLPRDGRRAWRVMMVTYREILREIERRNFNVFGAPIRLSRWRRGRLAVCGLFSELSRGAAVSPEVAAISSASPQRIA